MKDSTRIWKTDVSLEQLNAMNHGTIHTALGIQFTRVERDYLEATMPVDSRTHNPGGILHGGASVVLAESLGSVASVMVVGPEEFNCVGLEVNASHLRSIKSGTVVGKVTPVRIGRSVHVWDIEIRDGSSSELRMICRSRLTVVVTSKKP